MSSPAKPEWLAFPDDGFVALALPAEMFQQLPPGATAHLVRVKSVEGFKAFMLGAIEAASFVWPEVAAEWKDVLNS